MFMRRSVTPTGGQWLASVPRKGTVGSAPRHWVRLRIRQSPAMAPAVAPPVPPAADNPPVADELTAFRVPHLLAKCGHPNLRDSPQTQARPSRRCFHPLSLGGEVRVRGQRPEASCPNSLLATSNRLGTAGFQNPSVRTTNNLLIFRLHRRNLGWVQKVNTLVSGNALRF